MIIEIENLYKTYQSNGTAVNAVNGVSFRVEEGSLFSFLGVNGAGKSTTINILTTFLEKTSGRVLVGGYELEKNPDKIRDMIGVVFQNSVLDNALTVEENLEARAALYGLGGKKLKNAVDNAIKTTGLTEIKKRRYENLSGGQRRRADIARALVNTPRLLFLDEPTTGLDPKTRQDIWNLISDLQKKNNMTVFLTTHYMEEAAESQKIVVIDRGIIKAEGTPEYLKEKYTTDILKITLKNGQKINETLKHTVDAFPFIDRYRSEIKHIEIISGTLDDVFLKLQEGNNAKNN